MTIIGNSFIVLTTSSASPAIAKVRNNAKKFINPGSVRLLIFLAENLEKIRLLIWFQTRGVSLHLLRWAAKNRWKFLINLHWMSKVENGWSSVRLLVRRQLTQNMKRIIQPCYELASSVYHSNLFQSIMYFFFLQRKSRYITWFQFNSIT